MIAVTFQTIPCYLIDDQPNWSGGVSLTATIPQSYERGLSGKETRRPMGDTIRFGMQFNCIVQGPALNTLRNSLQALAAAPVLCPLWPAQVGIGMTIPTVTAAYYILFNVDGSYNSIQPASGLPFAYTAYPLMMGILTDKQEPVMLSGYQARVEYKFSENGNYPITMPTFNPPAGLNNASGNPAALFPFLPNWSTIPMTLAADFDVTRKQIGAQRVMATAYYTQRGRRRTKQSFTLQGNDSWNLLSFYESVGGEQNNFWLGAAINEANLTANVASGATTMTVDNGAALGTNSFILMTQGSNRTPLVVSSVAGNTWNLLAAPGVAFTVGARIESLILARFDNPVSITFRSPVLAKCESSFIELPWETNAVAGETYGTTMGALPVTATFFQFTMTTPSATTTWRYTSYERNLSDGVHSWQSAPMQYDGITETADLKRNDTTISSRNFSGNPLALLFPLQLEWPLMVQIYEGDVTPSASTVANLRCYFYGEVGESDLNPPFIEAKCSTLSHIFDRQVPRRLYQQTDNWALFEPANGLLPANWKWTAVVVSYNAAASTLVLNTIASSNGATLTAHYFAAGYIVITSAGGQQVRMVGDNTAPAGGSMSVYLSTPLTAAPSAGDTVAIYPGYDGQAATAQSKFNNYQAKFGGFPFIPVGNPTVLILAQPTGGKK